MIDTENIPGNSKLVKLDLNISDEGSKHEHESKVLLVPKPSKDPNDPLNWTTKRKYFHMFCLVVYVFGIGVPTTSIYSVLTDIAANTNISVADLNDGTGYMFLFLGIGCFIYLPLSLKYGKRPCYLFSCLACCLFSVWQPYVTTNGTWIGSKILQGFVASAAEALPEVSVSDVFFEHERGAWMGVYALSLYGSNYLAPLISGFVNDGLGWKWVLYLSVIWNAVAFVFIFLFLEESSYARENIDDKTLTPIASRIPSKSKDNFEENIKPLDEQKLDKVITNPYIDNSIPVKTIRQRMAFSGHNNKVSFAYLFAGPFKMLQFPVVLWSGFIYGATLIWYSVMNATLSLVFTSEPYNFSSAIAGVVYTSPLIFAIIFYVYAAWALDYLKVLIAKRRNGNSKAEDRLWSLILYIILGPASLILWGVGAYHKVHWFGLVIGCGVMGGLAPIGCNVGVTYTVDSYHEMSCEAMVVIIIIRNGMSFAVNYGITPWVTNMGFQNSFIMAAFICLGTIGSFCLMIFTGPYWRARSREGYWKLVAEKERILSTN